MVPWIAGEAGLPMLEGSGGMVVRANEPAIAALGSDPVGADLLGAAAHLVGVSPGDAGLASLVSRARAVGSASGPVGDRGLWRLMAMATGSDAVRLVAVHAGTDRLASLERRAAAADVSAGVSHEIANALSAMVGWAQLGRAQSLEEARETFRIIEECAVTARSAARRLLDAVRSHPEERTGAQDLTALAGDVERLLRPEAQQRGIDLEWRVPAGVLVHARSSSLFTILWNLVRNAVEALVDGGRITVTAVVHGPVVRLVVADDGPGMDEDQRLRAFDPYFSTKATGTGLGLPMVKRAVEDAGGRVALETARGRGTRFVVELPRSEEPASSDPRLAGDGKRRSGVHGREAGTGRILLIEDDQALREMMRTTLALHDHRVHVAASAQEARSVDGKFDVALVDLTLGDARGDHLVAELRELGRISAVALVTGATEPPNLHPDGKPELWLRKPFEPGDLLETVRLLRTFGGQDAAQTGDPV